MALGDGSAWDETTPVDSTLVSQVDDYCRDDRIGVRSRMAFEHEWPSSQSSTVEAGKHKFITLQNQAAKPTIAGTQLAALYTKTVGSGLQEMFFENEAGTEVQLTNRTVPFLSTGAIVQEVFGTVLTAVTCNAVAVIDDTVPQDSEASQVVAVTITPLSNTNNLEVVAVAAGAKNGLDGRIVSCIFNTASCVAAAPFYSLANHFITPTVKYFKSGSIGTAAITFNLKIGCDSGAYHVNAGATGARVFGGVVFTSIVAREIKA